MSGLEEKARYPLIPLEGNRMTVRDASQEILKTVTKGPDELVFQSTRGPLLYNHLLQRSEIRL